MDKSNKSKTGQKDTTRGQHGGGEKSLDPHHQKLADVGDAPESGEPGAAGRSRGRVIDDEGGAAGRTSSGKSNSGTTPRRGTGASTTSASDAPESGRQDATP